MEGNLTTFRTGAQKILDDVHRVMTADQAQRLATTNEVRLGAARRAEESLAPCHRNKNSLRDALILETFHDFCAQRAAAEGFAALFITSNKDDFSDATDHRHPHPDLLSMFGGPVRYFINVAAALESVDSNLVNQSDVERVEQLGIAPREAGEWFGSGSPGEKEGKRLFPSRVVYVMEELALWIMRHRGYERFSAPGGWPVFVLATKSGQRLGIETLVAAVGTDEEQFARTAEENVARALDWLGTDESVSFALGLVVPDGYSLTRLRGLAASVATHNRIFVVVGHLMNGQVIGTVL